MIGLKTKNVGNRDTRQAIAMFIKTARASVNQRRSGRWIDRRSSADCVQVIIGGYVNIRLEAMKLHASNKNQGSASKLAQYINIIRYYLDNGCSL